MANALDEEGPVKEEGREVGVIAKKLPVTVGTGSKVYDVIWWFLPPVLGGVVWMILKAHARSYFKKLEQKLQHDASQIDNYLEQRVQVLKNCARLLDRAEALDRETFKEIAKYRSGNDEERSALAGAVEAASRAVNVTVERYPELRAHEEIAEAMRQNAYLQKEITAAREVYNDTVNVWNREIFSWPTKTIVAAKEGYTTRIP